MPTQKFRNSWPVAAVAVSAAFLLTVPNAFAAFTSSAHSASNSASAGSLSTIFVDSSGAVLSTPLIQVANAAPSMAAQSTTIRIKNVGTLPADARLHVTNLTNTTSANLNDVLLATVTDAASNVLYSGNVAGLDIPFSALPASSTKVLTLSITWPDLPNVDDNPYQDAGMSFEIAIDASSLA
jgi:hypothetical protein